MNMDIDNDLCAERIARTILAGFNKHYGIFRSASAKAKQRFERRSWREQREVNRLRIDMYDTRVMESVAEVAKACGRNGDDLPWATIKQVYIGLLYGHKQPELAETFYNSVAARVLHRTYHTNEHIFTRPAVSTEHIEGEQATYRCYYPLQSGVRGAIRAIFSDFGLAVPLADSALAEQGILRRIRDWRRLSPWGDDIEPNFNVQVLSSLFFRNKAAYAVGCVVNGKRKAPFAVALRNEEDGIWVDSFLYEHEYLVNLLSVSNAYFMADIEVPSAWVTFLHDALPDKPRAELYMAVGLQKQGKTDFFRDMVDHLKHTQDSFTFAPGTRGMVMVVFTLPSFPFVFKVIRDSFPPPKDTSRQIVMEKYRLVKLHDRVGRLADTLEYLDVAFPLDRFQPRLMEEMKRLIPSSIEFDGNYLVIKHLYIEQRLKPLDVYLTDADDERVRHGVKEFGEALRDLAAANIFPGDILPKNFGLSPYGRGLLYDYDEVTYLTDCNFRPLPRARDDEDEMRAEPWYNVGPNDVFPEEFPAFLFGDVRAKRYFTELHGELLVPDFWYRMQKSIHSGNEPDLFPYPEELRFLAPAGVSRLRRAA